MPNPQNFPEAYGIVILILRFAGLFPFEFDVKKHKFHVSWKYMCITLAHILIYTYVNATSIMENWRDYSQPMMGNSSLSALGNLALRLLGIGTTFVIMIQPLVSSGSYTSAVNMYLEISDEIIDLGIDAYKIFRRIYYLCTSFTVVLIAVIAFNAWHSSYFYEHITHRPPELKYYLVVILSSFYRFLFLYYQCMQLIGICMVSRYLNQYLSDLKKIYRELYDEERRVKYGWLKTVNKFA